ncbi:hypothetical protein MMPV_004174 [Pyropia vietnamensis]
MRSGDDSSGGAGGDGTLRRPRRRRPRSPLSAAATVTPELAVGAPSHCPPPGETLLSAAFIPYGTPPELLVATSATLSVCSASRGGDGSAAAVTVTASTPSPRAAASWAAITPGPSPASAVLASRSALHVWDVRGRSRPSVAVDLRAGWRLHDADAGIGAVTRLAGGCCPYLSVIVTDTAVAVVDDRLTTQPVLIWTHPPPGEGGGGGSGVHRPRGAPWGPGAATGGSFPPPTEEGDGLGWSRPPRRRRRQGPRSPRSQWLAAAAVAPGGASAVVAVGRPVDGTARLWWVTGGDVAEAPVGMGSGDDSVVGWGGRTWGGWPVAAAGAFAPLGGAAVPVTRGLALTPAPGGMELWQLASSGALTLTPVAVPGAAGAAMAGIPPPVSGRRSSSGSSIGRGGWPLPPPPAVIPPRPPTRRSLPFIPPPPAPPAAATPYHLLGIDTVGDMLGPSGAGSGRRRHHLGGTVLRATRRPYEADMEMLRERLVGGPGVGVGAEGGRRREATGAASDTGTDTAAAVPSSPPVGGPPAWVLSDYLRAGLGAAHTVEEVAALAAVSDGMEGGGGAPSAVVVSRTLAAVGGDGEALGGKGRWPPPGGWGENLAGRGSVMANIPPTNGAHRGLPTVLTDGIGGSGGGIGGGCGTGGTSTAAVGETDADVASSRLYALPPLAVSATATAIPSADTDAAVLAAALADTDADGGPAADAVAAALVAAWHETPGVPATREGS